MKTFVTIASIPPRFANAHDVLERIDKQTFKPDRIVMNVCGKYDRFPDSDLSLDFGSLRLQTPLTINITEDIGAATKFLGFTEYIKSTDINPDELFKLVIMDDDCEYDPHVIEKLCQSINGENEVAAMSYPEFDNVVFSRIPNDCILDSHIKESVVTPCLAGYTGMAFTTTVNKLIDIEKYFRMVISINLNARYHDDAMITSYFRSNYYNIVWIKGEKYKDREYDSESLCHDSESLCHQDHSWMLRKQVELSIIHLPYNNHKNTFTRIYENNVWGNDDSEDYKGSSGYGSKKEYNLNTYIPFVRDFIEINNIKSIVDLGCGIFDNSAPIYEGMDVDYCGYDAYQKTIEHNKNHFGYEFVELDFLNDFKMVKEAELCILKDVVQHWPFADIKDFFNKVFKTMKFKYVLMCNGVDLHRENSGRDISVGGFRTISAKHNVFKPFSPRVIYNYGDHIESKEVSLITVKTY
jgi:SAM-dependent methyltransferase